MKLQSILAIYVLFWTLSLFLVLPFGVRTRRKRASRRRPGQADSAPHRFSFGRAALRATIVSAVAVRPVLRELSVYGWIDDRHARLEPVTNPVIPARSRGGRPA